MFIRIGRCRRLLSKRRESNLVQRGIEPVVIIVSKVHEAVVNTCFLGVSEISLLQYYCLAMGFRYAPKGLDFEPTVEC